MMYVCVVCMLGGFWAGNSWNQVCSELAQDIIIIADVQQAQSG